MITETSWVPNVPVVVDLFPDEMMLGLFLIVAAPFIVMWLFIKLSQFRPKKTEVVGPHLVVRVQKQSNLGIHSYYRCKSCEKEFEHKFFFENEGCETPESASL